MRPAAAAVVLVIFASGCHADRLTKREYEAEMQRLFEGDARRALREWPDVYCDRAVSRAEWLAQMRYAELAGEASLKRLRRLRPPTRVAEAHEALVESSVLSWQEGQETVDDAAAGEIDIAVARRRLSRLSPEQLALFDKALRGFQSARYDVFGTTATGWTAYAPLPPGC